MVHKFVFVEGAEPHVTPRGTVRSRSATHAAASRRRAPTASLAVLQWLLLGAALAVSAVAFSAAKASFERHAGPAAAER